MATSPGRGGDSVAVVHKRLRDAILRGDIPAGQLTSQVTLAQELGVSRTPLREAVRLLQREGLVFAEPGRSMRIAEFSAADIEQLYAMRIPVEVMAIRVTVPRLGPEDIAELTGLLAQVDHFMAAGDAERMGAPHAAFHGRLVAGAGPRVATTLSQWFDHAERYRRVLVRANPETTPDRRAEHHAILDAAASGDADRAAETLVSHYVHTAVSIFHNVDPTHEPSVLKSALATMAPAALESPYLAAPVAPTRPG
jgi:DNA-binding GntR family transcriptional regulator